MAIQGIFTPSNPKKYKGDAKNIVYRSSWELKCMIRFDSDTRIVWWSSEEGFISYPNPVKKRMARYFPDFLIGVKNSKTGKERVIMIEVSLTKRLSNLSSLLPTISVD